jgi:mRNA interferase RelE/StbE
VPVAPSELRWLPDAIDDLKNIYRKNFSDGERIEETIDDWARKIQWGRVPQTKLKAVSGAPSGYNLYRQWIGRTGYRVVYEISDDEMVVVCIVPKDDHSYEVPVFIKRVDQDKQRE